MEFSQIEAMRLGVSYSGTLTLRGFTMVVRPLSIGETVQVAQEVNEALSKLPEAAKLSLTESTLIAQKTLVKASTTGVGKNDPTFTELLATRCTPDELQSLFAQYIDLCEKVNPSLDRMKDSDLSEIVARLKKNPSELTQLSRSQLLPILASFLFPKPS